jgi:hypothetical protein
MRLAASDLVRIDFTEVETLHWSPQPAPARRNGYLTVEFSGSRIEAFVIMNTDPYWPATRGRPAQARHAA